MKTNTYTHKFSFRLKVRQNQNDFFKPTFLPKNERTNSTMIPQVDLVSFVFWKKLKTQKRHFEIKWPLEITQVKHYLPTEGFQKRNDATENGPRELALLQAGFLLYIRARIIAVGVKLRCDATIRNFETRCSKVRIFWEGHKNLRNLHLTFVYSTYRHGVVLLFTKSGLISESFSLWLKSSKKRCEITFLSILPLGG